MLQYYLPKYRKTAEKHAKCSIFNSKSGFRTPCTLLRLPGSIADPTT